MTLETLLITSSRTFNSIGDKEKILAKLEEVTAELEEDMERTGWTGKTVTLKYKLDTYQGFCDRSCYPCKTLLIGFLLVFTRAKSFDRWISTKKEDLFAVRSLSTPRIHLCFDLSLVCRLGRNSCYLSCHYDCVL